MIRLLIILSLLLSKPTYEYYENVETDMNGFNHTSIARINTKTEECVIFKVELDDYDDPIRGIQLLIMDSSSVQPNRIRSYYDRISYERFNKLKHKLSNRAIKYLIKL